MNFPIKKENDPILREPTSEVANFGFEFQSLVDNMIETMRSANGVGLAAPQVGVSQKVFVCEFAGDKESELPPFPLTVICNPEIKHLSKEKVKMVEGCLSFPGLEILVKRPRSVVIAGVDRYGNPIKVEASGLFGRVIQHENDHLNSTLLVDHIVETKIVFIGTGTLGLPALSMLVNDRQYKIGLVVTGNSRSISRSEPTKPIALLAKKLKLPLLETENINDEKVIAQIKASKASLAVMADFGQIVSKEVLDIFKYGVINIHPSLLPRHRGPSPIAQTILDGDKTTGVTLLLTSERMDAGGIISQAKVKLSGSETAPILKEYLAKVGGSLVLSTLPYYLAGDLEPEAQEEGKATKTKLFKKEDGLVGENTPASEVERKIRAFAEWPKVYTVAKGKRVLLLASHFDTEGNLVIDRVKPEGKKEMSNDEFVRGYGIKLTFS